MKRLFPRQVPGPVYCILLATLTPLAFAKQDSSHRVEQVRETVTRLFSNNIQAGTRILGPGIKAYTPLPMSEADISEITAFGDDALPVLQECLKSPKERFRELAVRCLGYMGDNKSIQLLEATVLSPESQSLHIQALQWIGWHSTPMTDASLHRIVEFSKDEGIRKQAAELLKQVER